MARTFWSISLLMTFHGLSNQWDYVAVGVLLL